MTAAILDFKMAAKIYSYSIDRHYLDKQILVVDSNAYAQVF
jgi:hypothetical protein